MTRKAIEIPPRETTLDPREPELLIASVDMRPNGSNDFGSKDWRIVGTDEHGNPIMAPPSRHSIWR